MFSISQRPARLFLILSALFVTNALIAEFVGVKIFALEDTLGLPPFDWRLFGQSGSLSFTAGVMLWPIVFIMTDIINEYFGVRGVRFISWMAVGLITYAFLFAYLSIHLAPAAWWVTVSADRGVPDMQAAFAVTFGQGLWTIAGSITAFLIGQLIDVSVFHRIRKLSGERFIWLRATASTAVSTVAKAVIMMTSTSGRLCLKALSRSIPERFGILMSSTATSNEGSLAAESPSTASSMATTV